MIFYLFHPQILHSTLIYTFASFCLDIVIIFILQFMAFQSLKFELFTSQKKVGLRKKYETIAPNPWITKQYTSISEIVIECWTFLLLCLLGLHWKVTFTHKVYIMLSLHLLTPALSLSLSFIHFTQWNSFSVKRLKLGSKIYYVAY